MAVRVTQIPVEVSIQSSAGNTRVTQIAIETSVQSTSSNVRVTQIAIEASALHGPPIIPQPLFYVAT